MATLYYVVYDAAATPPTDAQVSSGLAWGPAVDAGNATANTSSGVQSFPEVTGLSAGDYKASFVWHDGVDYSNVVHSATVGIDNSVTSDIQSRFDIYSLVTSDINIKFNIYNVISNSLNIPYSVLNSVISDINILYDMKDSADSDLEIVFNVGRTVASDMQFVYDVSGVIFSDFKVRYDIDLGNIVVSGRANKHIGLWFGIGV